MVAASLLLGLAALLGQDGLRPASAQVSIEYIAHACFRIQAPGGTRILIDPYASRVWIGYDFPRGLEADLVLITHPHYDHDGGERLGKPVPWSAETTVLRDPGAHALGELTLLGIRGKHADPYGKEFGQKNTIWLLEIAGLRIAHLGDNGPLSAENVAQLGRVDVLMLPIDGEFHILAEREVERILEAVNPRVLVPMHYKHPDLEPTADKPDGLGPIAPWLQGRRNVVRLDKNVVTLSAKTLLPARHILVFPHSPVISARR